MCDAENPPEFGLSATVLCDTKLAFLSAMWHDLTELSESQKCWQSYAELLPL